MKSAVITIDKLKGGEKDMGTMVIEAFLLSAIVALMCTVFSLGGE